MAGKINHIAVVVAAVAYYIWGALWFMVFGAAWRAATGITMAGINPTAFVVSFFMGLVLAYAIAIALKDSTGPNPARHGIEFGLFMSVAIWLTNLLSITLYEHKPLGLWAIDGFYVVIGTAIMGAIVGGWRKRA